MRNYKVNKRARRGKGLASTQLGSGKNQEQMLKGTISILSGKTMLSQGPFTSMVVIACLTYSDNVGNGRSSSRQEQEEEQRQTSGSTTTDNLDDKMYVELRLLRYKSMD